ncbi:hypothetical protein [Nocardia sp. XZ_19_385]|uniref:hypothetical protein n=1 Tax=Nocardia sp. XZ_19_385 TaxID=2769488 RepID=UPI00188E8C18|nr:hypothetical protein [Nocardia sp. XZ_19_385]
MWGWSEQVAEYAAAASGTAWRISEPEPTVLDPQDRETEDEAEAMNEFDLVR